jgi:ubiquinone/menaquinone biosynthesis C-methylase UbiE
MPEEALPDYAVRNRASWTAANAQYTAGRARESWGKDQISWGVWKVPEDELRVLPDVRGLEVIELGCGTAYFGAWLKKRGARRVVGVDITPAQLATAREMNAEFDLGLEFIEANAEDVPLPDASFDIAFSEYGASIWCDPYLWIPEAARLLRPGGELIFARNSTLQILCSPDDDLVGERLVRPQKGMHHIDWQDEDTGPSTDFHISASEQFRLLRDTGFELLDFRELYPPDDAVDHPYYKWTPVAWAKQWPAEEIWRARLRQGSAPPGRRKRRPTSPHGGEVNIQR